MKRVRGALTFACIAACGGPAPKPVVARMMLPAVDAGAPAPEAAAPPVDGLATLLCAGREPCAIRRNRPAGHGLHGEALAIVSLDLGHAPRDGDADDDAGSAGADDNAGGVDETANEDQTSGSFNAGCRALEYWLVDGAPGATPPRLLAAACNDGYGASMVGIDILTVGDNTFKRAQGGGSTWRWSYTNVVTLSPLHLVSTSHSGYWAVSVNRFETTWDWDRFAGTTSWYSPACEVDGSPPKTPEMGDPYASILVPRLPLPEAFRKEGFRDAALGACAVDLDGTGDHGYVTYGPKGDRAAASIRAVLSDQNELFVEVHDAHPSGATARPVVDDHLEIWLARTSDGFNSFCVSKGDSPQQWGVRVADGKVFAGYGSPKPSALQVDRVAKDPTLVRFRIVLPPKLDAITVAYSDGDGKKQQRIFGTSTPKRGLSETVGASFDVQPDHAVCEVRDGRLEPRTTYAVDADKPFADDADH